MIEYNLFFKDGVDIYEIHFMKIQEFFSQIGGIIIIIYLVFDFITIYVNRHDRTLKLVNKLFDFSNFENEKSMEKIIEVFHKNEDNEKSGVEQDSRRKFVNNHSKDNPHIKKLENHIEFNRVFHEIQEKPKKRDLFNAEKVKALFDDRRRYYKLGISVFFVIKAFLCKGYLSKREDFFIKIFQKSKKIINNKLDVVNYLKFYQEYSMMKTIIFNDITNLCLTLLKKPNLYEKNTFSQIHLGKEERIKKVFDYFSQKDHYTANDYKLLEILSDNIKKIVKLYKENCYL